MTTRRQVPGFNNERSHVVSVLVRALVYSSIFVSIVLIYVPVQVLNRSGISGTDAAGPVQFVGLIIGSIGALVAVWSVITFAVHGKGTPAPFDPPRTLVTHGPYRFVRNPMYLGATLALAGVAIYGESFGIGVYTCLFAVAGHLFVVFYEEPNLSRTFGREYESYCRSVRRWF